MQLGDQLFKTIKHKEVFEKDLQEFQKNKICFQSKMNESFEELRLFETHD